MRLESLSVMFVPEADLVLCLRQVRAVDYLRRRRGRLDGWRRRAGGVG